MFYNTIFDLKIKLIREDTSAYVELCGWACTHIRETWAGVCWLLSKRWYAAHSSRRSDQSLSGYTPGHHARSTTARVRVGRNTTIHFKGLDGFTVDQPLDGCDVQQINCLLSQQLFNVVRWCVMHFFLFHLL